jgi:hypothetical protein
MEMVKKEHLFICGKITIKNAIFVVGGTPNICQKLKTSMHMWLI